MALTSASAFAIEPAELLLIQKGPTALKPQLELSQTFTDNVTYRENDEQTDFITTISPGLSFQVGSKTFNFVDLTYFFDRVQHWDEDELSANQHRLSIGARFEKSRFLLEGLDEIKNLSSPLGGGISAAGEKIDRITFFDVYKLTYDLTEKTAVYLEALHARNDFDSDIELYDSYTLSPTLGFEYNAFSRTSLFGEAYYGLTENEKNFDSMADYPTAHFVGAFVGARGSFTEKLVGMVKAGAEYRWYQGEDNSSTAPVVGMSLTERFTDRSALQLSYTRAQRESAQFVGSTYVNDTLALDFTQHVTADGRLRAVLSGAYSLADYEFVNVTQTVGNTTTVVQTERTDHLVTAGLTFTYDVKLWFRAFAGYNFEYLESSLASIADYQVNRVTLGMQLGY